MVDIPDNDDRNGKGNLNATTYDLDTYAIHYIALSLWVRGALRDLSKSEEEAKLLGMKVERYAIEASIGMMIQLITQVVKSSISEDEWYDAMEGIHNTLDKQMDLGSEPDSESVSSELKKSGKGGNSGSTH